MVALMQGLTQIHMTLVQMQESAQNLMPATPKPVKNGEVRVALTMNAAA